MSLPVSSQLLLIIASIDLECVPKFEILPFCHKRSKFLWEEIWSSVFMAYFSSQAKYKPRVCSWGWGQCDASVLYPCFGNAVSGVVGRFVASGLLSFPLPAWIPHLMSWDVNNPILSILSALQVNSLSYE